MVDANTEADCCRVPVSYLATIIDCISEDLIVICINEAVDSRAAIIDLVVMNQVVRTGPFYGDTRMDCLFIVSQTAFVNRVFLYEVAIRAKFYLNTMVTTAEDLIVYDLVVVRIIYNYTKSIAIRYIVTLDYITC